MSNHTVNDELFDLTIRHAIMLRRLDKSTERRLAIFLRDNVYPDISAKLERELGMMRFGGGSVSARSVARLRRMKAEIRELVRVGMRGARNQLSGELFDLAKAEADWQLNAFAKANPFTVSYTLPAASALRAVVNSDAIQGRTLSNWFAGIERGARTSIERELNIGIVQGESISDLVRRVRGTASLGFKDGVYATTTRNAQAIARTAATHVSSRARELTYGENDSVIKSVQYVATLDARTSETCASLSGRVFPIGEGPRPPQHINCRSTTTPVMKSWKEMGIDAKELTPSTRASMNGQVPDNLTYNDWLRKMDKNPSTRGIIDDALGRERAKLFRGGLSVDRFTDKHFKPLTLDQIRAREGF